MRALPTATIRRAAEARRDLTIRVRRDLHRIPELAFQEWETTRYVERFLRERGIPFEPLSRGTGGVAVVGEGERAVILRADLDGLPVHEAGTESVCSSTPGRMHACGHDAHTAMLLGALDALGSGEIPLGGRAVCVFQPAEEGPGGCEEVLREGLLDRHPARGAVALHVWPGLPTGTVGVAEGPVMASMDRFDITFRGSGGHGAHPHTSLDPVVMAAEAVLALQTLVSRNIDPLVPAVLTVGSVRAGTAPNIIPDTAEISGTVRAYDSEVRAKLLEGVRRVAAGVAATHGGEFQLDQTDGYPITRNDPEATRRLSEGLSSVLSPGAVRPADRTMGSEDMGFLLEKVPGCYVQLGASRDPREAAPLHSPRFRIDEDCLPVGVAVFLTAASVFTAQ